MSRPKFEGYVQLSVLIPGDVYHHLQLLRVARIGRGTKVPPVGELIREALVAYVGRRSPGRPSGKRTGEMR